MESTKFVHGDVISVVCFPFQNSSLQDIQVITTESALQKQISVSYLSVSWLLHIHSKKSKDHSLHAKITQIQ